MLLRLGPQLLLLPLLGLTVVVIYCFFYCGLCKQQLERPEVRGGEKGKKGGYIQVPNCRRAQALRGCAWRMRWSAGKEHEKGAKSERGGSKRGR